MNKRYLIYLTQKANGSASAGECRSRLTCVNKGAEIKNFPNFPAFTATKGWSGQSETAVSQWQSDHMCQLFDRSINQKEDKTICFNI